MKFLIVLCALFAATYAIPIDSDTAVADIQPVQITQLRRVESPLSAIEEPVAVYDGAAVDPAESGDELVRPKRFILLKKLALAKAAAVGVGALGIGAIALKGGFGGGGSGSSGGYGNSYGGYNSGYNSGYSGYDSGNSGWSNGGYGGYGGGVHKTIVVWD